ncbi:MAG: sigma-70 family RNA polymerase sigma factor, partial [Candidatus Poribacteria bacterium]|nr:sigma-70 family RNA polymerase sigma factor [Candidatus Poribacteria bacterium]
MQEIASLVVRATNAELSESSRLTAFEEIVCRYQDMAVGYAFSLLGDFQLAEDTAQEALIDAWRNLESLVEPRAFSAWFRRIVARRCDRLTRRKRIPTTPLEAAMNVMDRHPAPDEQLEHNELRAVILNAIRALLDHERDATTLYYISGYTQAEVADFLDAPVGTIKQRLHSARKRLRKGLMHMVRDSLREYAPSRDTA